MADSPWKTLMQFRVVVTSCLDASILVGAQCTNTQLMAMEGEVAASARAPVFPGGPG